MNGAEHYRKSEQFLGYAFELYKTSDETAPAQLAAAIAQAHATLALAAATATLDAQVGPGGGSATGRKLADAKDWEQTLARGES